MDTQLDAKEAHAIKLIKRALELYGCAPASPGLLSHCQVRSLRGRGQCRRRRVHSLRAPPAPPCAQEAPPTTRLACRPRGLAFSFNGGKDSTVLLHLLLDGVAAWRGAAGVEADPEHALHGVTVFFFLAPDEFPEVADFVRECDRQYGLRMRTHSGDFKAGLQQILSETGAKAVLLGTRRGDPNCKDQVRRAQAWRRMRAQQ